MGFFRRAMGRLGSGEGCRTRRTLSHSAVVEWVECGWFARLVVLGMCGALMVWMLASGSGGVLPERALMSGFIYLLSVVLIWLNHKHLWCSNSRLGLFFVTMLVHVFAVKLMVGAADDKFAGGAGGGEGGIFSPQVRHQMLWVLLPHGLAPLTISILLGTRLGVAMAIFTGLFAAMTRGGLDASLMVMALLAAFTGALATQNVRRRADLLRAGFLIGNTTFVLALVLGLFGPVAVTAALGFPWKMTGVVWGVAMCGGLVLAMLVNGVIPILEGVFGITTTLSWIELADLNHPLLRRMVLEAPGTYHHSLMVAAISESAAGEIGADSARTRACAYFHDIGKLTKPQYFAENRGARDPHEDLTPWMSALVIIAHVKDGVDLALKHRLRRPIIDVIREHHGTQRVRFFLRRAMELAERARAEGVPDTEVPEVREESFRYPGPKPSTKESAILAMADSVESASRAMKEVSVAKLHGLVDDIVNEKIRDGQLSDCPLTMQEISVVKESFKRSLVVMSHSRIAYPEDVDRKKTRAV
jgi:putative nucleotidyltransferase with HDIG domain